jgi:hypothetical protein
MSLLFRIHGVDIMAIAAIMGRRAGVESGSMGRSVAHGEKRDPWGEAWPMGRSVVLGEKRRLLPMDPWVHREKNLKGGSPPWKQKMPTDGVQVVEERGLAPLC